jgi:hypothetical protein
MEPAIRSRRAIRITGTSKGSVTVAGLAKTAVV